MAVASLPPPAEPPHGTLAVASSILSDGTASARRIIDGYLDLAKMDLREELRTARTALIWTASSVLLFAAAGLLLAVGAALGLARALEVPPWATFVGIGAVAAALGAASVSLGRAKLEKVETPQVVDEVKEDVQWIAEHS